MKPSDTGTPSSSQPALTGSIAAKTYQHNRTKAAGAWAARLPGLTH